MLALELAEQDSPRFDENSPSTLVIKTKKSVKDESMDLSVKKEYKSRRQRGYEDS